MKSDASRYLWFDWQAQWSSLEVQPSSISRYSLLGAPYANKSFEYSSAFSEELSDSEDYLTKLAKARKNYLSNWSYAPYLYSRLSNWYKTNLVFQHIYDDLNLKSLKVLIKLLKLRWRSNELSGNKSVLFTSASADFNTPGRSSWKPQTGPAGVTYRLTTLSSLLAKREHFYRRIYHVRGLSPQLPQILVSSFKNPLLNEVRKSLPINDPINLASESSRQFFYQNTNFLKLLVLKEYLSILSRSKNSSLDYTITNSWILRHFFELHDLKSTTNTNLLKNQFRPMRKGVSNMVRLQATGAVALPVEIRLHILASSKDVIHSWAIPAAGVKIDCVPGYSSHRVTIFLLSGIFYGQCMEICGRYHHWMPIVAYFVKVDIFLLWCFHHTNLNHNKPGGDRASNLLTSIPRPASL
jgi:heme/copper-type cytochrome/quinol oxidase subunit 2